MLGILDYILFALNLGIGAVVGIYYLVKDRRNASNQMKQRKDGPVQLQEAPFLIESNTEKTTDADTESTKDYFIDTHGSISPFQVACSMFSSNYSAVALLGLPGMKTKSLLSIKQFIWVHSSFFAAEYYTVGSVFLLGDIANIIGIIFIAQVFIPIFYNNHFSTIYEYIEVRFESSTLRKITALGSALYHISYAGVGLYIRVDIFYTYFTLFCS